MLRDMLSSISQPSFDFIHKGSIQAPWLPIILLINSSVEEKALRIVQKGYQDYLLTSELEPKLLTQAIHYAIEHKRYRRNLKMRAKKGTFL